MATTREMCFWMPCSDCTGPDFDMFPDWVVTCHNGECMEGMSCWHVPIPSHLIEFNPYREYESKSFLGMGKLCEYLIQYTMILQYKGKQFFNDDKDHFEHLQAIYDESFLEKFLKSLKIIQTWCISKSRESLEILLSSKMPSTAAGIVFKKLFVDWDSFEATCKFEQRDESMGKSFEIMYKALILTYITLRNADASGPYCDDFIHNLRSVMTNYRRPSEDDIKFIVWLMSELNSVMLKEENDNSVTVAS